MKQNETLSRIQTLMNTNGWSIYKLSKESHIPYSSLNNLFLRNNEPTLPTLRKICKGLGISLSDFFSDDIQYNRPALTEKEKKLIVIYRSLTKNEAQLLMTYASGLKKMLP